MANEVVTTYCGQSVEGWEFIGTEDFRLPVNDGTSMETILTELKRCCGQHADFYLFKTV